MEGVFLLLFPVEKDGRYLRSEKVKKVLLGQVEFRELSPVGGGERSVPLPPPDLLLTRRHPCLLLEQGLDGADGLMIRHLQIKY